MRKNLKNYIKNVVVVSDLHCGCKLGLCPEEKIQLDDGGTYYPSDNQVKVFRIWNEFWNTWVPQATRKEPYIIVVNGDTLEGQPFKAKTPISINFVDQRSIAIKLLKPVIENNKCKGLYLIRGTEAHVGKSAQEEEQLARDLQAIPNETGQYSRWELWLRMECKNILLHFTHHIGTTSSTFYESTAVQKEMGAAFVEAGQWENSPPDCLIRCLSEDTEILTNNGWKGIDNYNLENDFALVFNSLKESLHYEKPTIIMKNEQEPEMVHFIAKGIDILVTPDHNMIAKSSNNIFTGWRYIKANHFLNHYASWFIPVSGQFDGRDIGLSDSDAFILGVIIGDGTFCKRKKGSVYGIRICQSEDNIEPIISALDKSNISYSIHKNTKIKFDEPVFDRRSYKWIKSRKKCVSIYIGVKECGKFIKYMEADKSIKREYLDMDKQTFVSLLKGLVFADGSEKHQKFFNNNENIINQVQELMVKHGYKSSVNSDKKRGYINKKGEFVVNLALSYKKAIRATLGEFSNIKSIVYNKRSWCIQVPSGTIVTRRNGKIAIVGNSHRHRFMKVVVPTKKGQAIAVVTPGWQLKTPYTYRLPIGRFSTPQFGGIVLRSGDEDPIYVREFVKNIDRPLEVLV